MSAKTAEDIAKELSEKGKMDPQEADALVAELQEWQIWGAHAVGGSVGFFTPLYAFDAIDKAIDDSGLDANVKAALKWTARGGDLTLGIIGTATNIVPIAEGNGKWYNHLFSSMSLIQIPFSLYKMLQLGGVIGGGGGGVSAKKSPAEMRAEMDKRMTEMENRQSLASSGSTVEEEQRMPEIRYPAGA